MIQKDYGLLKKPITTRNPQANGILERIHQTVRHGVAYSRQYCHAYADQPYYQASWGKAHHSSETL